RRLGADDDALARHRFERPAEHRLGAVGRRRVEQVDAQPDRLVDDADRLGLALPGAEPEAAEPAAAEPGDADPEPGPAERRVVHAISPDRRPAINPIFADRRNSYRASTS